MTQLYVPDKVWLVCSDGMNKQPIKVTSQQTVKIAGGRLAATKEDRTNGNFICGKMLVAGAIVGAVIATLTISTGGLGGIILGTVLVTAGGAAVGTLISMIPCFCALTTMPNDWIGYHPKVKYGGHNPLLENATLFCMLGGKIEIIYFEEFADARLSEIRKNVAMEAGIQALKVTAFLRFPKTFITANVIANVGLHFYTGSHANDMKTVLFAINNPNESFKIMSPLGEGDGKYRISNNVTRFQQYLTDKEYLPKIKEPYQNDTSNFLQWEHTGVENEIKSEGTQGNAFRHVLWQSSMTTEFGGNLTKKIGDSHELNNDPKFESKGFNSLSDADQYIDLQNNVIGREIGSQYPNASTNELADKVLDYYYENGLWEAKKTEDGKWEAIQTQLPKEQYEELKQAVGTMNRYGYFENTFDYVLKGLGVSDKDLAWFKTIPKAKNY